MTAQSAFRFENDSEGCGYIYHHGCRISVMDNYESSFPGESHKTQLDRIRKLLDGERGLRATFENHNGESDLTITEDGIFQLHGGSYGPPFGSFIILEVNYLENKEEIDKFLNFMLNAEYVREEPDREFD